jgi:hypothetical protein
MSFSRQRITVLGIREGDEVRKLAEREVRGDDRVDTGVVESGRLTGLSVEKTRELNVL